MRRALFTFLLSLAFVVGAIAQTPQQNQTGQDAGDKAKAAASEVGDKAEDVGDKTVDGAKAVGKKTAEGAKKTGKAVKDALTP